MRPYYDRLTRKRQPEHHDRTLESLPVERRLEQHGIRNINIAYWNLGTAQLLEHAIQRREGELRQRTARSWSAPASSPAARPRTNSSSATRPPTPHVQWGAVNQPMSEAHFDRLYARDAGVLAGPRRVRAGLLRRRRPGIRAAHPRDHPAGLAQPVRAPALHPPRTGQRPAITRPQFTILFAPGFPGRSGAGRHQLGDLHRHQLQEARGADRAAPATPAK